jgi:hypothetical protein
MSSNIDKTSICPSVEDIDLYEELRKHETPPVKRIKFVKVGSYGNIYIEFTMRIMETHNSIDKKQTITFNKRQTLFRSSSL